MRSRNKILDRSTAHLTDSPQAVLIGNTFIAEWDEYCANVTLVALTATIPPINRHIRNDIAVATAKAPRQTPDGAGLGPA